LPARPAPTSPAAAAAPPPSPAGGAQLLPDQQRRPSQRKIYEILLAWKIENNGKDQILEVYMNQIYLGQRAYGFASAAQIYFGKQLKDLTIAEAAMLAGLPKAPSAYNPVVNPKRAHARQQYILQRMRELGYITEGQYQEAKDEELQVKGDSSGLRRACRIRGRNGAPAGLRAVQGRHLHARPERLHHHHQGRPGRRLHRPARGVMDYERRHGYRGPEAYIDLPEGHQGRRDDAIEVELADHPDSDDMIAAVVLEASPRKSPPSRPPAKRSASPAPAWALAPPAVGQGTAAEAIRRGAVIRVMQDGNSWIITQMPEVESAFVSASTTTAPSGAGGRLRLQPQQVQPRHAGGASRVRRSSPSSIRRRWKRACRRPPSSTMRRSFTQTGGQVWEPKNYDGKFEGPMTMRRACKSKNMVSIRILQRIGVKYAQEYITRFGFDADKNPPYLTLALGAGNVTPLQMVGAYSVFANGGYKINPT
jgi:penicillin-binding protein 1A